VGLRVRASEVNAGLADDDDRIHSPADPAGHVRELSSIS
jgi:hypothetical protein